jgi:hypothetical protein
VSVASLPKVVKPKPKGSSSRKGASDDETAMGDWKPNDEKMTRGKQGDLAAGQPQGDGEVVRSQSPHTSCEAA